MVGRTLSHFRITAKIGEGGMGVVYRAEDERLRRTVAIKVLPAELTGHEERRLRFLREAQAAAALNHPNICTIHEVDSQEGVDFLVMELLDGVTLRDHLGHRPMPIKTFLPIAIQVGEALAAAHAHGVLHRDLKPENIFITTQGTTKVLDFGLAKILSPAPEAPARDGIDGPAAGSGTADLNSRLDTLSRELTLQGKVFGTVAYMSPEQARGRPTAQQSDLFSFGIVLYEMATGRQPFRGDSDAETLASVIKDEIMPAATLAPDLPAELDRIIGKCLEKDLQDRYHHADELVADLRRLKRTTDSGVRTIRTPGTGVTIGGSTIDPSAAPGAAATRGRRPLLLGAGLAVLLVGAATTWWVRRPVVGLKPGDTVIVADFENRTGRPEYDTAPRAAFEYLLARSTYLDVVSGGRLEKLRGDRIGDAASRIDRGAAEKLCAGGGCAGYVLGSIAAEPPGYRIDLTLHRLGRQGPAAALHATAASDLDFISQLHQAANDMREAVGESPAAIANSHPPATRSLEALGIVATAVTLHVENPREELTLLMRAIQIDPRYADAYEQAALAHQGLGQWFESRRFAEEAYRLSADLPPQVRLLREILALDARYDVQKEVDLLRSYRRLYPLDDGGANWLGWLYMVVLHDPAAAEPHLRAAYEINPDAVDLHLLCDCLARQGKVREIEALGREVESLARVSGGSAFVSFWAAVARDEPMATVQAIDRPEAAILGGLLGEVLSHRTNARLIGGRFVEARGLAQAGLSEAARSNAPPASHLFFEIPQAWLEWRRTGRLPALSRATIEAAGSRIFHLGDVSLLAEDVRVATPLRTILTAHERQEQGSTSRFVKEILDMARGTLALIDGSPEEARTLLEPLAGTSRDPVVHHLLARTYEALGLWGQAAVEYEETVRLSRSGFATPPSVFVLDRFRLAQAHERAGDLARARDVYARFVEYWKEADPDIPELVEARARLAALGGPQPGRTPPDTKAPAD